MCARLKALELAEPVKERQTELRRRYVKQAYRTSVTFTNRTNRIIAIFSLTFMSSNYETSVFPERRSSTTDWQKRQQTFNHVHQHDRPTSVKHAEPASVTAGPQTATAGRPASDGQWTRAIDSVDRKKIIAASHARLVIITPSSSRVDNATYGGRSDHTRTQETWIGYRPQQQCHGSNRLSLQWHLVGDPSSASQQL